MEYLPSVPYVEIVGAHHIVEFVVAMDDGGSIGGEVPCEPSEQFIKMRYRPDLFASFDILRCCLGFRDCFEGLHLPNVISSRPSEFLEANAFIWN